MSSDWVHVRAVDHSLGVLDSGRIPAETSDYSTGLIVLMSAGARIYTGIDTGPVRVRASAHGERPPMPDLDDSWSDIVEASVFAPLGNLRVDSLAHGPAPRLPNLSASGPGWYRIRVCARGRDTAFDQVCEEPVEDYVIAVWPQGSSAPVTVRSGDRCGQSLRMFAAGRASQPTAPSTTPVGPADAEQERQAALRRRLLQAAGRTDATVAPELGATASLPQEPAARPTDWRPGR
ncbi:hypothetical protein ACWCXH_31825 [Kitasatospora sp. NPDC001660]